MPDDKKISAPDLTKRPPRSPRQRLGGHALLPRMLDKGRAEIAGTSGEYHYNCPLDQRILNFLGLDPGALREQLATGKGDGEILQWISENAQHKRTPWEIEQWSDYQQRRGPDSDAATLQIFAENLPEALLHPSTPRSDTYCGRQREGTKKRSLMG